MRELDCATAGAAVYFAPAEVPIRGAEPCGQKSGLGPEGVRVTMGVDLGPIGDNPRTVENLDTET